MAGSDGTQNCHIVCIDTNLGTRLITAIPSSETVPDFKKRLLHEHVLCFPRFGDIKIDGLKVKRRGKFYYLSESILVKSAFDGVTKSWFIDVDASIIEEHNGNPTNVDDNKQIGSCDKHLCLDVDSRNIELGIKLEKGYHYGKENKIQKEGAKSSSEATKFMLQQSTISQKSPVDKQHTRYATLDVSAVHSQLVSPRNEIDEKKKKKKKGKKKSAKPFNQETAAFPSTMTNVGTSSNPSNLGEKPAAALATEQHIQDVMSSEPDAIYPKDKQGDPAQEINSRHASLEIGTGNKEAGNVEGGHEASGAAIASNINRKRVLENDGAEEHQNHVSVQNGRVERRELSLEISPKTASSQKYRMSSQDDLHLKAKEEIVASKLLEASETVDPPKLSKKRKKRKKTKDVNGFISTISPTKRQKIANGDHLRDTFSGEESNRIPEVEKEMDTMDTSFHDTYEEINDVIWKVVESVQQMVKDQVGTEAVIGGKDTTASAQKLESISKKSCPEANEVTHDVEVSCQSNKVDFNDYFGPREKDLETAGSSEMLVDEANKTNGADGMVKAKKRRKKKQDAYSDGLPSYLPVSNDNRGLGAKSHSGNSSPVEFQVSFAKANSRKSTLKPNKEPSEVSDRGAKPLVSSKSDKVVYSVPEKAHDAKATGTISGSTRTPSDVPLSDAESNADYDSSQNGSCSWKREEGKPISLSGRILRSSSSYKKTTENLPV